MKRRIGAVTIGLMLTLALAATAGAHNLEVTNPQSGEVVAEAWVGGSTVPADAEPMFGPFNLPPSHGKGLVHACAGTASSPAVQFLAPPFGSCQHGQP